jgi:hypothetical protein
MMIALAGSVIVEVLEVVLAVMPCWISENRLTPGV